MLNKINTELFSPSNPIEWINNRRKNFKDNFIKENEYDISKFFTTFEKYLPLIILNQNKYLIECKKLLNNINFKENDIIRLIILFFISEISNETNEELLCIYLDSISSLTYYFNDFIIIFFEENFFETFQVIFTYPSLTIQHYISMIFVNFISNECNEEQKNILKNFFFEQSIIWSYNHSLIDCRIQCLLFLQGLFENYFIFNESEIIKLLNLFNELLKKENEENILNGLCSSFEFLLRRYHIEDLINFNFFWELIWNKITNNSKIISESYLKLIVTLLKKTQIQLNHSHFKLINFDLINLTFENANDDVTTLIMSIFNNLSIFSLELNELLIENSLFSYFDVCLENGSFFTNLIVIGIIKNIFFNGSLKIYYEIFKSNFFHKILLILIEIENELTGIFFKTIYEVLNLIKDTNYWNEIKNLFLNKLIINNFEQTLFINNFEIGYFSNLIIDILNDLQN